jgi:hypothetical protein
MPEAKERPQCRKAIEKLRITPHIVNGTWDGHSYWSDGKFGTGMSEGLRRQLRKMVKEGVWGPIRFVNDLFPNPTRVDPTDDFGIGAWEGPPSLRVVDEE